MNVFQRTASALAVAAAFAGAASLTFVLLPAAAAQESAEARFAQTLHLYGIPGGLLKWASVEETPAGFIARGVTADLTGRELGVTTIPLGDLELSGLAVENGYLTRLTGRLTGLRADLPALMAAGAMLGQSAKGSSLGMGVVMGAGYIQGLGYSTLDLTLDFSSALDFATGEWRQAGTLDVANAFKLDLASTMSGVTPAYVDWALVNGAAFAYDPATSKAAAKDPAGPLAKAAFSGLDLAFDDQGILSKFTAQIAAFRLRFLGTNADGTQRTELSEDDLRAKARELAATGSLPAEKLLPVVRAVYGFLENPDIFAVSAAFDPALTVAEFHALAAAASGGSAASLDWTSRLTLDAHN